MAIVSANKWKLARVLPIYDRITPVSDADFESYTECHSVFSHISVVEDNSDMAASYLMINRMVASIKIESGRMVNFKMVMKLVSLFYR
jgi:phage-related minor tail protein